MYFKSFFDEHLAHMSYLVGCQKTGEAIVIDPARNIEPYMEIAKREGLEIVAAAETHIHADYLSGARELAHHLGAKLYLSDEGDKDWKYYYTSKYNHKLLTDGSTFFIGKVLFEVEGITEELAREAFALAAAKLPVGTVFVTRTIM
jgi:hydroxyacylglutathione hydrolase